MQQPNKQDPPKPGYGTGQNPGMRIDNKPKMPPMQQQQQRLQPQHQQKQVRPTHMQQQPQQQQQQIRQQTTQMHQNPQMKGQMMQGGQQVKGQMQSQMQGQMQNQQMKGQTMMRQPQQMQQNQSMQTAQQRNMNMVRQNPSVMGNTNTMPRQMGNQQMMNQGGNAHMANRGMVSNTGQRTMMSNVKQGMGSGIGPQGVKREGQTMVTGQHGNPMGNTSYGASAAMGMGNNMGNAPGGTMASGVGSRPIGMMNSSGNVTGVTTGPTEQEFSAALAAMPERLNELWKQQQNEMEQLAVSDKNDYKHHNDLPLARIKRIMKSDEDVRMISAEAPILFAKACEIFILDLTVRAWCFSEHNKRNGLEKDDIYSVLQHTDIFDFLAEVVINNPDPRTDDKRQ